MMRRSILFALAGAAIASVGGCGGGPTGAYRFRMTVEVETPKGLARGSSVYQVTTRYVPGDIPGLQKAAWNFDGEAIAVDLPNGQTLFALLWMENDRAADHAEVSMAALDPLFDDDQPASAIRIANVGAAERIGVLKPQDYPVLAIFGDLADPSSVRRVNPTDFAPAFGPGFRLNQITVAVTQDAVTTGIAKRLAWFQDITATGKSMLPFVRGARTGSVYLETLPGYDETLSGIGPRHFTTSAYK